MKKTYSLEDLECANCAAKMQDGICRLAGVKAANVNFLTQKLTIEADDAVFDDVLREAVRICRRIEPDCTVKL
ncbi:MAG: cation transporter [Oscillospiraceae bacterium]|nr:cation transporter [Oscillospiraceae bacterium]